jgi:hypothetical protein
VNVYKEDFISILYARRQLCKLAPIQSSPDLLSSELLFIPGKKLSVYS